MSKEEALEALERLFNYCEEIDLHLPEGDPDRTGYNMVDDVNALRHYILFGEDGITKDKNIKNCENCGWWTCKDMNKRRCQYCYKQDEWIPDYDDNNGIYKENITIKADKHIKGYSNKYPLLCDLEVIFSNNKEWITLRDNCDSSITVEIKSLIKLFGYGRTIGDMIELVFRISLEDFKKTWGGGEITEFIWNSSYYNYI